MDTRHMEKKKCVYMLQNHSILLFIQEERDPLYRRQKVALMDGREQFSTEFICY